MSSFATYLIGFLILIVGLGLAAYLLNVPTMWIGVGVIVLIGIGVLSATSRTKMRDPADTPSQRPPSAPNADCERLNNFGPAPARWDEPAVVCVTNRQRTVVEPRLAVK